MARGYLPLDELHAFYSKRARSCQVNQEWENAERAFVAAGEVDMAVSMYKGNKMWLPMLKLVQQHRREQLPEMHLLVAHVSSVASCRVQAQPVVASRQLRMTAPYIHSCEFDCWQHCHILTR